MRVKEKVLSFLILGFAILVFPHNLGEMLEGRSGIFVDAGVYSALGNPAGTIFTENWALTYGMMMEETPDLSSSEHNIFLVQPYQYGFAGALRVWIRSDYGKMEDEPVDNTTLALSYSVSTYILDRTSVGLGFNFYKAGTLEGDIYSFNTSVGFIAPIHDSIYFSGSIAGLLGWSNVQNPFFPDPIKIGFGLIALGRNGILYVGNVVNAQPKDNEKPCLTLGGRGKIGFLDFGLYTDLEYSFEPFIEQKDLSSLPFEVISDVSFGLKLGFTFSGISTGFLGKLDLNDLNAKGLNETLMSRGGLYFSVEW